MKRIGNTLIIAGLALGILMLYSNAFARGNGWGHGKRGMMRGMGQGNGNGMMMQRGMGMGMQGQMGMMKMGGARMLDIDLRLFSNNKIQSAIEDTMALQIYKVLDLDKAQKTTLKAEIERVKKLRKKAKKIKKRYENKLLPLIKQAKKEISSNGRASKQTINKISQIRRQYSQEVKPIREEAIDITNNVQSILRPEQIAALRNNATLRFWQPNRMGMETDDSNVSPWALAFIDRLRIIPKQRLDMMKQHMYQRAQNGNIQISTDKLDEFFSFIDQIRALSPEQYEERRLEMAADLDPVILELVENHKKMMRMHRRNGMGMNNDAMMGKMGRKGFKKSMKKQQRIIRVLVSDSFLKLIK